jgi:hypothetical protein
MATTARRGIDTRTWSPARVYLVVTGIFLAGAALTGFGVNASFPTSAEAALSASTGHIYGIFETNGWHNVSTLVSGLVSLAFATRPSWARTGAFVKATLYTSVTVAVAVWGPETFLIASNAADQVVHGSLAAAGFAAGLATPRP